MRINTLIRKSDSWAELFVQLQEVPSKIKGDVFERVVQLYLKTHPEYETRLSEVWRLDEVPLVEVYSYRDYLRACEATAARRRD